MRMTNASDNLSMWVTIPIIEYEEFNRINGVPLIKPIGNYTHLEQEINVINSKSNKVAVPWDVKHTNLYQFFGADAPTSVKQCSYLGIMKRGKFINHFDADELDQDVWYLAEYIPKDDGVPPKVSEAVKSHVI